ncbi:MAG: ribose-5-phosphate isomerase [Candidatus Magasanikbacteria bacterium CG10_big_fil_rev_8_21_14_0_10_36_16]|uniref:Ribose-5-phosphate isomerase n=1 Tax=Candidatus Magasanikbacteria bacterium CG10_big_fil_rev_8_21_14_0_10_36_16 TaxID=1974645 RepID=A0A2H0TYK7_9BACT|nr:MAG: ribose-5-phosphate isomerase [Candidatus Magasanikbacteria bacterium CG10_big_fil_rev_8_21_14_0_10_36_16]
MYSKKIYIASDHGGYQLKKRLIRYIENELNLKIEDLGPYESNENDDYPDYVIPLAHKVAEENVRGIVICKNGVGVSMAVNKVTGIRCGIGYNIAVAESMMNDDNTNVLALASKLSSEEHAMVIVKKWLETEFGEEKRHVRRLEKVAELEK